MISLGTRSTIVRVKTEAKSERTQLSNPLVAERAHWPLADRDRRAASFDLTRLSRRASICSQHLPTAEYLANVHDRRMQP
jgi:hypothetical protein